MGGVNMTKIETLDVDNYDTWRIQMEAFLIKNDSLGFVTGEIRKPEDEAAALEWELADSKVKADILLAISPSQLKLVRGCATSRQVWDKLSSVHQARGASTKATLLKKLILTRMKDGDDVRDHIDCFFDVVAKLENMEVLINDDLLTVMLLYSLSDDFNNFRDGIVSRDVLPGPQNLKVKILEESESWSGYKGNELLNPCLIRNRKGDFTNGKRETNNDELGFECRERNVRVRKVKFCLDNQTKNTDTQVDEMEFNVLAENYFSYSVSEEESKQWCLDSGSSSHMTNDYDVFLDFQSEILREITMPDNFTRISRGSGTAIMEINGGEDTFHLYDTLYVPELKTNIISVAKITDMGYEVLFKKDIAFVLDHIGKVQLTADREDGHFNIRQVSKANPSMLSWHLKYGHLDNFRDLKKLIQNTYALSENGNCIDDVPTCETHLMGKYVPKHLAGSKELLEIIHSDICGPTKVESLGKSKYFISFVDNYSRWTEVMFLRNESEALDAFKRYKSLVENFTGKKIKYFQTDRGGKLLSDEFSKYLEECGIKRRLGCTNMASQQCRIADRTNKKLIQMARCFLLDSCLSKVFWAEAVATASHIRNRSPSEALAGQLPYTFFKGKTPNLSYCQSFGCRAVVMDESPEEGKCHACAKDAIFVGYSQVPKGYKLWVPKECKFIVSMDVIFFDNFKANKKYLHDLKRKYNLVIDNPSVYLNGIDWANIKIPGTKPEKVSDRKDQGNLGMKDSVLVKNREICGPKKWEDLEKIEEPERTLWYQAAQDEFNSLQENNTWTLTELPPGRKAIECRWLFKVKYGSNRRVEWFKARLVAKGYSQKYDADFDELFAPTVNPTTVRILLAVAATNNLTVRHFDMKTTVSYGDLAENTYVKQPEGFIEPENSNKVYKLNRSLYGLKQGARACNEKLNSVLLEIGFHRSEADPCLYIKVEKHRFLGIVTHVDDMLCVGSDSLIDDIFKMIGTQFGLKDMGNVANYLGIEIEKNDGVFLIHQRQKIEKLVYEFGLEDAKPIRTPMDAEFFKAKCHSKFLPDNEKYRRAIGSLEYISETSRPDIAAAVDILSKRIKSPTNSDWEAVERIIIYLNSTRYAKLRLNAERKISLACFVDTDLGGVIGDRGSVSGYFFKLRKSSVAWFYKKQQFVSLPEFISTSMYYQETLWIQQLLKELGYRLPNPIPLFEDI